jgi:hypothetical protein
VRRRAGSIVLVVLACGALAGCAIPTQGSPQSIPASKVPTGLMDPHPPTTTTTLPDPSSLITVKLFFLDTSNRLTPESRFVPSSFSLQAILTVLIHGPTSGETANGVTTALPNDVAVLSATTSTTAAGSIATVNMNSAFTQITGNNAELAVGQIVATVAAENGPGTGVLFEVEGQRTSVPIANGSQVNGPVYALEFISTTP